MAEFSQDEIRKMVKDAVRESTEDLVSAITAAVSQSVSRTVKCSVEAEVVRAMDEYEHDCVLGLDDDEIRALGGYAPIEIDINQEKQDVLNNLNTLSPLVANKVLESMTTEEIRALVGLTGSKPIEKTNETTI